MMRMTTEKETTEKRIEEEIKETTVLMKTEEDNQHQRSANKSLLRKTMLIETLIQDFNHRNNENYKVFYVKLMNIVCFCTKIEHLVTNEIVFSKKDLGRVHTVEKCILLRI